MEFELRDYQVDMIDRTRASLSKHQRVLLQAPTGAGKTALACHMMATAASRGLSSFFLVHQNELLNQTSKSLWHNKLQHGLIASGRSTTDSLVQLASIQTLKNRLDHFDPPSLIIIDESHRALAKTYQDIVAKYSKAKVVGLTATPRRTDGKGLGHLFEDIIHGPSIRYLIDAGFLCDYELFGVPPAVDTSSIKTTRGDYDTKEAAEVMNKPHVTGDAIEHWLRLAKGRKTVVMCVDVDHAESVAKAYNQAGIKAQAIHGKSSNREKIIDDFENGDTMVLTSVQLLIEGIDIPSISCTQWLRPTQSIVVYMQGNGRGLRPHHSKDFLLILDHASNFNRHGLPCDHREWDLLDSKKRGPRTDPNTLSVQTCKKCYLSFRSGVHVCPHCGTAVEFKERKLLVVEGELERIEKAAAIEKEKRERRQEQGKARSIEDLVRVGLRRNLNDPSFWAAKIHASRNQSVNFSAALAEARKAHHLILSEVNH